MIDRSWSRRETLKAAVALGFLPGSLFAKSAAMLTRPIPASGESLPVIGLGTWQVFDVAGSAEELALRQSIIELLVEKGGSLIDSSPMYARARKKSSAMCWEAGENRDQVFSCDEGVDQRQSGRRQPDAKISRIDEN